MATRSAFHTAVWLNDVDALREAIRQAPKKIDKTDERGNTALLSATMKAATQIDIIQLLLAAGANPNRENPKSYPRSPLSAALGIGNLAVIRLLDEAGADLHFKTRDGYTAMMDAVHGLGDRLPIVQYLLERGVSPNAKTKYNETPLQSAYGLNLFPVVKALLEAGADESPLNWSPLIRAIATGTRSEAEKLLNGNPDLEVEDETGRTAIEVALAKGELELVELLHSRGANLRDQAIVHASEGESVAAVEWLLAHGADIETKDRMDYTPLTVAVGRNNLDMVRTLLAHGADPNPNLEYSASLLSEATTREMIDLLIAGGTHADVLDDERRRLMLGLGEASAAPLAKITRDQFLQSCYPREGSSNPEDLTTPFLVAMFQSGLTAWGARDLFDLEPIFACSVGRDERKPVWCAVRFGQTLTRLPDGRTILIAGEHEDYYDPDFCIYNDVIVVSPEGEVTIYGYPYDVFPPTDFHTATLVGDDIYIIGSLGYIGTRETPLPVYRLDTKTFRIERAKTTGEVPPRLYEHKARLDSQDVIEISGGKSIGLFRGREEALPNGNLYRLDVGSRRWISTNGADPRPGDPLTPITL